MAKKQSGRIPGPPFRYIDVDAQVEADGTRMEKLAVHGDGERGIGVRTATPKTVRRAGNAAEQSPLK